ncbi:FtsW/RodA/SpoVE family cell cycle protein [Vagococcus carniphilus]|uniref:FtsW/RodA/SpoVE family cell cycle protein n=1 Tax=Vagococcus carniphilus TaxID=218144 RepID=A0AAW8U6L6_9ENTE|nr:FtsW/RodA/SpoVE family cell cycle protein [Vagococcus carniphilus]MDT2814813.1 FtsW/RodA/SpoVE family cell cycle protein [Vagococcus carniphilus]MDT2831453.1 FtsW/RodA/SpoVE family cell cycle protein [Vagococcus carniphilus]MDT2832675.1 FtsW/RodA/SpoVE family cell cycle protein [Vagococcus carniphilus]MDT2840175.1 FtsW/RodA/SpoVE family cell cycle protein [Vagococcus carniphilus]MDT2855002.1 FtsW/RodA/SpoVE family cell cycle protein [Vagococcus carniphilus]
MKNTVNYGLLLPIFLMLLLSIWLQYWVATYEDVSAINQGIKQIIFVVIGVGCMVAIKFIDKKLIWKLVPWIYVFSLLLMLSLYFFYDANMYTITGTKRWLDIAGVKFQPSELAKIAYILFISKELIKYDMTTKEKDFHTDLKLLGQLILYSIPLFALMFMQKDFGTSLVFVCVLGALLIAVGLDWRILATIFGILMILGIVLILLVFTEFGNDILASLHFKQYQLNRIKSWRNPYEYSDTIAYQQVQGLVSMGSGGIFGKGSSGIEVYVPVRESDMIFTFIGEAYGFVGASLVIILYFYLFFQIFYAGLKSNSKFNIYICVGIVFMLVFQTFENIGASIGLLPLTGIPLPFLSQGGTSLVATLIALGLIFEMKVYD